jgi:signal peptidase II
MMWAAMPTIQMSAGAVSAILAVRQKLDIMLRLHPTTLVWFAIAAAVLLSDQFSKLWIMERYAYGEGEFFTSFFNLVRAHNYGAAFSFLSDAGGWQRWAFSLLAAVISIVITVWIARLPVQRKLEGLALALILGGALGNLYDRLTLGYVVDFLDFHWSGSHFPAFNIADSGISVGAVLLILDGFINKPDSPEAESE